MIKRFFESRGIKLNTDKTTAILFSRRREDNPPSIRLDDPAVRHNEAQGQTTLPSEMTSTSTLSFLLDAYSEYLDLHLDGDLVPLLAEHSRTS
ncbi:hypothetical protein PR048_023648 [Dryococelus australis]|uniref:Reverse transcriptase n=1 Tax=Dryococelus australis TaxID=614101 RepID=A0ABQ9GUN6_9NEOP|nr:hypothetical protein PR048_023648 [Dryococelus australis]